MPLPESLRQPLRRSSTQARGNPCRICHNLDPRGHPSSVYSDDSSKQTLAGLTLVIDALSLGKTKESREGGCRFCGVLCQALDSFAEGWRGTRKRVNVDLEEKATIKVSVDEDKWRNDLIEIYNGSVSHAPWQTLGTAHRIPPNSGSDDTFNFARRCIQDCLTNPKHAACRSPQRSSIVAPKRLLDVGRVASPIRLIDTLGKSFEYAALSHCWGTGPTLTTTKNNWQKLASNVPFEALPPLFQDAVIITRQLGLRYIWIDSLCIVQDSVRDWETESSKMGSIYESSYVTISATSSPDGSARCLTERRKPVRIGYANTTGREFTVKARKVEDHHPAVRGNTPARITGRLTSRAWVLQEHVLSTRILHFTASELLFECKTSYRCECRPVRKAYPTTPALIPKAIAKKSKDSDAIWTAWHRIVELYSRRELTVSNDKLPAISGIASKIKEATCSPYLAGLWTYNIGSDLLWSTFPGTMPEAQYFAPEVVRAPSFSWASLDTPIAYYTPDEDERETFKSAITLISSSISVAGLNPLGAVSCGSIKVRGLVVRALLSSAQREGTWEYTLLLPGTRALRISHDCLLVEDGCTYTSGAAGTTIRRALCGDRPAEFKAAVLCLTVARYDSWISGLVLGASRRAANVWERLGTFEVGEVLRDAANEEVEIA